MAECIICYENSQLLDLSCGCRICSGCFMRSLDSKYLDVVDRIKCPGQCQMLHEVTQLIQDQNLAQINDILFEKYVRTSPDIRLCPRQQCNYAGSLKEKCFNYECFCGYEWREQKRTLSSMSNYLLLFTTRECPRCARRIQKNGGCNHMTCKCLHEFCWICTNDFRGHSKVACVQNMLLKYGLLLYLALQLIFSLGQLGLFFEMLLYVLKLVLFNGSLMFLYLGLQEFYRMERLRRECNKYYQYGNETYSRLGSQKMLLFVVLMAQSAFFGFCFYLLYQDEFIAQCVNFFVQESGVLLIVGTTIKLKGLRK